MKNGDRPGVCLCLFTCFLFEIHIWTRRRNSESQGWSQKQLQEEPCDISLFPETRQEEWCWGWRSLRGLVSDTGDQGPCHRSHGSTISATLCLSSWPLPTSGQHIFQSNTQQWSYISTEQAVLNPPLWSELCLYGPDTARAYFPETSDIPRSVINLPVKLPSPQSSGSQPPKDTRHHLGTVLVDTTGEQMLLETRDAAEHPWKHKTALHNRVTRPKGQQCCDGKLLLEEEKIKTNKNPRLMQRKVVRVKVQKGHIRIESIKQDIINNNKCKWLWWVR